MIAPFERPLEAASPTTEGVAVDPDEEADDEIDVKLLVGVLVDDMPDESTEELEGGEGLEAVEVTEEKVEDDCDEDVCVGGVLEEFVDDTGLPEVVLAEGEDI